MSDIGKLLRELDKVLTEIYFNNLSNRTAIEKTTYTNVLGQFSRGIDLEMEKALIKFFKDKQFPCIIEGEEFGRTKITKTPEFVVIVDPLDGSTNFSRKIPLTCYGIAIASLPNKKTSASFNDIKYAAVRSFHTDEYYYAEKNKGATLNGKKIQSSINKQLSKALIAIDMDRTWHKDERKTTKVIQVLKKCKGLRRFGANIIDMCYVAAGKIDAMIDIQDSLSAVHTPGIFIAKESGAVIALMNSSKEFNPKLTPEEKMSFILANNKKILTEIIDLLEMKR